MKELESGLQMKVKENPLKKKKPVSLTENVLLGKWSRTIFEREGKVHTREEH